MKKQNKKSFPRGIRIAAKVQTLVAEILRDNYSELNVTLAGAESHGGLRFVRLFWHGDKSLQKKLNEIAPTIRYQLAQVFDQKFVPELQFAYDDTLEKSMRIEKLLEGL